ncbi:NAD(P)-dependent oxidoreductase [Streptomyces sp. NPDC001054]
MSDAPLVAVLGTGIMGAGMARSLLREGLSVRVWNRSTDKARPLVADGAELAADPAAAVRGADVVLTVLNDGTAVASVMEQAAEGLRAGQPWLQASTVGLAATATLAEKAAAHGVVYLDSPVSGTKEPAEQGKLIVLVSGDEAARPAVTPVLDAIGQRTVWAGSEPGDATRLKLVVNSWLVNLVSAVAESLNVADALGVDPRLFLDTVTGGALDSPYLQMKADALLKGALDPSFALSTALKDTRLILEATRGSGARLDLLDATATRFARARDEGHGGEDMIATYFAGQPEGNA